MKERIRPIACFGDSSGQGRAGQGRAERLCKYLAKASYSLPDPVAEGKTTQNSKGGQGPCLDLPDPCGLW